MIPYGIHFIFSYCELFPITHINLLKHCATLSTCVRILQNYKYIYIILRDYIFMELSEEIICQY